MRLLVALQILGGICFRLILRNIKINVHLNFYACWALVHGGSIKRKKHVKFKPFNGNLHEENSTAMESHTNFSKTFKYLIKTIKAYGILGEIFHRMAPPWSI
jgi:hypothetical protein